MSTGIRVVAADEARLREDSPEPSDTAPDSVLARLRKQSAEQARDRHVDVEIGGAFDPPIIARYGVLPPAELDRYSELVGGRTSNLELILDMLVRTCRGLFSADDDGVLVELVDELGTVTYGHRLAVLLGMPIPPGEEDLPGRDAILMLFGGNGFAIAQHATEVVTWMQNPGGKAPGESSAATG